MPTMRILLFNWRDIRNPTGGGAELLTHEMAKRWVSLGHTVTMFVSSFTGGLPEEEIDGVQIIRRGHPDARSTIFSVHFLAFVYYMKIFRGHYDVVIDEIHGIPFFTPWYVREKTIVLICEVAKDLWKKMFGSVFGTLGSLVEKFYLRFVYQKSLFLTISPSTKDDLIREGVDSKHIVVLPMGLTIPLTVRKRKKEKRPTLVYVGRLSKSKGIEDAIAAVGYAIKTIPTLQLWIIGRGEEEYTRYLQNLARELTPDGCVHFLGFLPEEEKFSRLSRAHLLLAPSMMEGWGLTVPEAGIMGTPAVAYNTQGLRDVVHNGVTGLLCKENTPEDLARSVLQLLRNPKTYSTYQKKAELYAKRYTWDDTASSALGVLTSL